MTFSVVASMSCTVAPRIGRSTVPLKLSPLQFGLGGTNSYCTRPDTVTTGRGSWTVIATVSLPLAMPSLTVSSNVRVSG